MKQMGIQGRQKIKKYRSYRGDVGHVADNLVQRHFEADHPNEVWLTDVTEFKVGDKKVYLSAILDVFNREIIGHSLSRNPNFNLIQASFKQAFKRIKKKEHDVQPILHSDQGWLYQIERFSKLLRPFHMKQSMSRKGNCLDNALMEGFFGLLKTECIYQTKFTSVQDAIRQVNAYIDYYNNERIKVKFKGLSPVEFRKEYERQLVAN